MPDYDSGETIAFILDMPSGMIEELKQALEGLVTFDPNQQVVVFNEATRSQPAAMGHHLPGMILEINRRLDKDRLTPRIPKDHKGWSTLRRQAFLQFAMENFDWKNGTVNKTFWDYWEISWEDLAKRYPMVFEEQE